jgi:hypothetical protein
LRAHLNGRGTIMLCGERGWSAEVALAHVDVTQRRCLHEFATGGDRQLLADAS